MTLPRKIELLHHSSERMLKALKWPKDKIWWAFMNREVWIHLKLSLKVLWVVLRRKAK